MSYERLISIGLLGSDEHSFTYYIIKEIFLNSGYKEIYNVKNVTTILESDDNIILIMDLNSKTVDSIINLDLYFDILICTSYNQNSYKNLYTKKLVKKAKYIIINTDDVNSKDILDRNTKALIVTYGLNNKATITASSFNSSNNIEFNLYIQREYNAINGIKIELMEMPIAINLVGETNIYYGLGAIACVLSCGITVDKLEKAISKINSKY